MLVLWMCFIAQYQFLVSSQPTTNPVPGMFDFCNMPGMPPISGMPTGMPEMPAMPSGMPDMSGIFQLFQCFVPVCSLQSRCSSYAETMSSLDQMGDAGLSVEQLDLICQSDCTTTMFSAFTGMATCMADAGFGDDTPSDDTPSEGSPSEDTPSAADFEKGVNSICTKNPLNDKYCLSISSELITIFEKNATTAQEKQTQCGAFSQLGCCGSSLLAFAEESGDMTDTDKSGILSQCGWTDLIPVCGKFGEKKKIIELIIKSDIPWNAWSSMTEDQKLAAEFAASQDLKSRLGKDVFISRFTKDANDKVVLNFNVDSTGVSGLKEEIQNRLASEAPNWSNLEAAIPAVDKVTTSGNEVEEKDVTHELPTLDKSSSYRKKHGFFVLCSVIFLLTLF